MRSNQAVPLIQRCALYPYPNWTISNYITYYDLERLHVRISELELGDVMAVLDNPSNRMQERLSTAWRSMQKRESRTWGINDLIHEMEQIYDSDDSTVGALE